MKALVTGCAGFIGSHLTDKLLEGGYKVIGIDCFTDYYPRQFKEKNLENALKNDNFALIEKDILDLDLDSVLSVDYVFHEAAQAGVRKSWGKDFRVYMNNNIFVTQKLLEACKGKNIKKFIFASSSSVYGDSELPMKEDYCPMPLSPYGVSKLACESLCHLYWKNYRVPAVSLRYFTVYGERQRPDMAFHRFIKGMLNGEQIEVYGDGNQTRDFTYVGDILKGIMLAAECDTEGEVFNIGGGSRVSVNKILRMIEDIMGKKANVKYIQVQKGDVRHTYADISRAERIGYEPRTKLGEGLAKEIKWIKKLY